MKIVITIDTDDGSAFEENECGEVVQSLETLVAKFERYGIDDCYTIRDSNGNVCGSVEIEGSVRDD